jgi:oligoendopeptidase F
MPAHQQLEDTSELPTWNLNDLYTSKDDPKLDEDLTWAEKESEQFSGNFQGRLSDLNGAELGDAIGRYESILERLYKVMSYTQLLHAGDMSDADVGAFYQTISECVTDISSKTLFFTLELNRIDDAVLSAQLSDPKAQHFEPWIKDTRIHLPHQLDDDMEKLLHEKSVTGRAAWSRLFDELMADLRFDIDDERKTLGETLNLLSDIKGEVRKKGAKALAAGLQSQQRTLSLITNTLAKDKEIEDNWRQYQEPVSGRNLSNQVEDDVVEALIGAVKDSYSDLAHRYFGMKAAWFGQDQLDYWDRNAPLPEADDKRIEWSTAKKTVLDAYCGFHPEMEKIAGKFFDESWIDAPPRAGKNSGAFAHPTVSSAHPYVLVNYHGKTRDVMTLAHELGHGVHQVLAAPQGTLMANTPLTLAETASVFGEMLTFQSMLSAETDSVRRRVMLAGKIEDMMNTVVRQIAFHDFESHVHRERKEGELSVERLGDIWIKTQTESLGPALRFDDDYRMFWAYIPHFIHSPFYVYAYAFGDCLVNSLYDVYAGGHPGFQEKYLDMLSAGGSKRHAELLAPFGLDASDPSFWKRGLSVISRMIDELEKTGS